MQDDEGGRRSTDASADDDWRLQGQENYLTGVTLLRRAYQPPASNPQWDHDHCEFCWEKFLVGDGAGTLHEGYTTVDQYHWICVQCFRDFQQRFGWQVAE